VTAAGRPAAVRLVAVDLDGTALRGNGAISRATRRALRLIRHRGATVCVATGRAPVAARHYARILGATGPLICLDGALVLDGERVLVDRPLPPEHMAAACRLAEAGGGGWIALTHAGRVHGGPSRRPPQASLGQVLRNPGRSLRFFRTVWRESHRWSPTPPAEPVYKLLLWAPAGPAREALEAGIAGLPLHVPSPQGATLEVVAPGVSKGHALDVVARHLGLQPAEIVAFGDARNDVEMLAYAGRGVAMGGAPLEVLAVADAQTESAQEDGLAREIHRMLRAAPPTSLHRQA
jgi:hydroxymethylpyrimidine pyrophosphatase-like HAD family hydrolase